MRKFFWFKDGGHLKVETYRFKSTLFDLAFEFGHYDEEQSFGLGLGLFTYRVHFSLENKFTRWFMKKFDTFFYDKEWYDTGRELSLEISTSNISWNLFWYNGVNSRHKWRMSNFYYYKITNFILGKKIWEEEVIEEGETTIDMPEGTYKATYKIEKRTYKRERWFKPVSYTGINFEIPVGIPHEGKGENSWDMGMDATFGISFKLDGDLHDARRKVAMDCLRTRQKYGSLSSDGYAKWKKEREEKLDIKEKSNGMP